MATSGLDGFVRVSILGSNAHFLSLHQLWDIRNFKDKAVQQFRTPTPVTSLDLSQRDFLAVGFGPNTWVSVSLALIFSLITSQSSLLDLPIAV